MDDPWGSPWTTPEIDNQTTLPSKSADLAPPPRALLSAVSSPRIPAVVEHAPWGEDGDGYGDWAAVSPSPAQPAWGGGWSAPSPNLSPLKRDDASGRSSPIAWPDNIATSNSTNGSAVRQPSPDPWASELSARRRSRDSASTPRLVVAAPSPVDDVPFEPLETDGPKVDLGSDWKLPEIVEEKEESAESVRVLVDQTNIGEDDREDKASHDDAQHAVGSPYQIQGSRSSTPSNSNTDHDDPHQDSPITSVDEDPKRHEQEPNKPSGKVQSLVVKFDGLARAASQESLVVPSTRSRSRSSSVGASEVLDDGGDFGDFEDPAEIGNLASLDAERPATPQSREVPVYLESTPVSSPQRTVELPEAPSPATKFRGVTFELNLSNVEKLFDSTKLATAQHSVILFEHIPDHVIDDSFTEISERKTWYRISRFGSSRRHNAADDDSYRRAAWPTSTVRDDVIKIVRRWMEEDSIAGRVALGGGIAKTQKNMFGWDSSAEPIALDAVFGKKKLHPGSSSLQPPRMSALAPPDGDEGPKTSSSLRGPLPHQALGTTAPPPASFGWSTAPETEISTQATQPNLPTSMAAASTAPFDTQQAKTTTNSTKVASALLEMPSEDDAHGVENDDDDEWGEMVSSPVASKYPISVFASVDEAFGGFSDSHQDSTVPTVSAAPQVEVNNISKARAPQPTQTSDAWASADFSLFGAPSVISTQPSIMAEPTELPLDPTSNARISPVEASFPRSMSEMQSSPIDLKTTEQAVSAPTAISDPIYIIETKTTLEMNDDGDDEKVVQRIISGLPDLSYMLR